MEVIIAIDDLHPEQGWGCEGDVSVKYLEGLNKEYGCKFTLFVPSNYHGKYPLSKHQDWINFWLSKEWVELAAHGHYHSCERGDIGECEFLELDTEDKADDRIQKCLDEWRSVGYLPKGWRNPGWLVHPASKIVVDKYFDYVALHTEHNHGMEWESRMFFGHDSICDTNISLHDNRIMFQSHIAGDWNDNTWNKNNYLQLKNSIEYLVDNYDVVFRTLGEVASRKKIIYLIAVGDVPYFNYTKPLIQKYAEKINADIRIFDNDDFAKTNYPSPNFLLFDIFKEFVDSKYKEMLYMDIDIRILNHAPDIFEEVRGFGMVQDWKATKQFNYSRIKIMQEWLDKHYSDMKITHYFNGGVIVSDKQNIKQLLSVLPDDILAFWKTTLDKFPHGFNQNILNYCIIKSGIKYQELSDKWNKCCRNNPTVNDYFIHYVANKRQIQTDWDKFKDNVFNPDIDMTLESLKDY